MTSLKSVDVNGDTRPKSVCECQHAACRLLALGLNVKVAQGPCMNVGTRPVKVGTRPSEC